MPKIIFGSLAVALLSVSSLVSAVAVENKTSKNTTETKSPIQIKVSTPESEQSAKYLTLVKFKDALSQKFGDKVEVILSKPASAYKDGEEFEALGFDLVNIIVPSSTYVGHRYNFKDLYVYDLPFLFKDNGEIAKFAKSELPDDMLKSLSEKEHLITPLAFWTGTHKVFLSKKKLDTLDAFNGMTARSETPDGVANIYMNSLGVMNVKAQNSEQLFSSINKGASSAPDLIELNPALIFNEGLYKYYKDLTVTNHNVTNYVVLTNKRWFSSLPKDIQAGIKDTAKELSESYFETDKNLSNESLKKLKMNDVNIYYWGASEKGPFVNKAIAAHENYLKNINGQYLQEVYKKVR